MLSKSRVVPGSHWHVTEADGKTRERPTTQQCQREGLRMMMMINEESRNKIFQHKIWSVLGQKKQYINSV